MNRFEWVSATSVDTAIDEMRSGAVAKAGGVDLLDRLKEGIEQPGRLVNIRTISGLDFIEENGDGLRLGPNVTMAAVGDSKVIRKRWPALSDAASAAATPQIRNMATIGGNILQRPRCWYFRSSDFHCLRKGGGECFAIDGENEFHAIFDNDVCAIVHPSAAAVPLTAYEAVLEIDGPNGKRDLPIEQLYVRPEENVEKEHVLGAGEIIVAIRVPLPANGARSAYVKQGQKKSFDWPLADAAVVLGMDGNVVREASIVLGAAAPVPWRAKKAEEFLSGKRLDEATAREAGRRAMDGATPLGNNSYKLTMFPAVIGRALMAAR
ncbi:MAG: FAD binding domain-containing protein [Thermoanaerobaculia bacterium]|nr:FAD binding domain-containing protein [Thermoanaerobaculia bacterium]